MCYPTNQFHHPEARSTLVSLIEGFPRSISGDQGYKRVRPTPKGPEKATAYCFCGHTNTSGTRLPFSSSHVSRGASLGLYSSPQLGPNMEVGKGPFPEAGLHFFHTLETAGPWFVFQNPLRFPKPSCPHFQGSKEGRVCFSWLGLLLYLVSCWFRKSGNF